MAIAALVLGVLWIGGAGSLLAIVFGFSALNQIQRTGEAGKGMATWGMILGLAGLVLAFVVFVTPTTGKEPKFEFDNTRCAIDPAYCAAVVPPGPTPG